METAQNLTDTARTTPAARMAQETEAMNQKIPYPEQTIGKPLCDDPKMSMRNVNVFYGDAQAIYDTAP